MKPSAWMLQPFSVDQWRELILFLGVLAFIRLPFYQDDAIHLSTFL